MKQSPYSHGICALDRSLDVARYNTQVRYLAEGSRGRTVALGQVLLRGQGQADRPEKQQSSKGPESQQQWVSHAVGQGRGGYVKWQS